MPKLFRQSGGLTYHARALLARGQWTEFRTQLLQWLETLPKTDELVLIAPSGGYSLTTDWLKKYKKIYAYDIDPVASFNFKLRHSGIKVDYKCRDVFWESTPDTTKSHLSARRISEIAQQHPHGLILFCNVLGQIPLEGAIKESEWLLFLGEIKSSLKEAQWASYHDRYSVSGLSAKDLALIRQAYFQDHSSNFDLSAFVKSVGVHGGTWVDHLTATLATVNPGRFVWSLTPGQLHLIEATAKIP